VETHNTFARGESIRQRNATLSTLHIFIQQNQWNWTKWRMENGNYCSSVQLQCKHWLLCCPSFRN